MLENLACATNDAGVLYRQHVEAFNVDRVTGLFYRRYAEQVRRAREKIREWNRALSRFNDEKQVDLFTQRLFSRLLFLYFLQKKRWLGDDPDFLTTWYGRAIRDDQNFYQTVLVPLFFDVLNQDRPRGESPFGTVPYLNGGLFERDADDDRVFVDNVLFDPEGEGILAFLNEYDFTIEEDTPIEAEVALDPEMLGKVFENLLEEDVRQRQGTFYTPRPIVHYMCREALVLYLRGETNLPEAILRELFREQESYRLSPREAGRVEAALDRVRVLDPAVGSGAFLVGMLQQMVHLKRVCKLARESVVSLTGPEVAGWKHAFIQSALYGVDLRPEAVEIARLRLWLSLVVDLQVPAACRPP